MSREQDAKDWLKNTEVALRKTLREQFEKCPELSWADRNLANDKIDDLIGDLHSVVSDAEHADTHSSYERQYA